MSRSITGRKKTDKRYTPAPGAAPDYHRTGEELRDTDDRQPKSLTGRRLFSEKDWARQFLDIAWTMILVLDVEGMVQLINRKGCEILGYTENEIVGKNWFDNFIPPDVRGSVRTFFPKYMAEGGPEFWENTVLTKSGSERIIAWHNITLRDGDGKPTGTLSTGEDVTERRRAEQALHQSEEQYRLLADNVVDVIWTMDLDMKFTYVSPSIIRLMGYTPEEHMGLALEQVVAPNSVELVLRTYKEELEKGMDADPARTLTLEIEQIRKDRTTVWVEIALSLFRDQDGQVIGIMGVSRDISARKKAEDELRESEEKYRDLVENVNYLVFSTDLDGKLTFISPACERLVGYRSDEIVGRHFTEFVHPDDRSMIIEQFPKILSGVLEPSEYRLVAKSGAIRWVRTTSRPARSGGKVVGLNGILDDITDRKKAEETIRESERRFRLLAENAKDMIYRVRLKPKPVVEYISPSVLTLTGFTPEEIYANPILAFGLVPFDDKQGFEGKPRSKELLSKPITMRWERKDGGSIWLELVNHPVLNASKEIVAIEGVARDITERKLVEDALRESEEKFRDLAEQSPNMIFIHVKGRVVYANRLCEELTGYTREEFYSPGFDFMTLTAPEHRALVAEKYGAHLSGREVSPYEYSIITKGGRRIEAILSTKLITYSSERALLGTITDITETKKAEKALRESEDKFRRLFESSPEGVVMFDLEGRLIDINEAGIKLLGIDRAEALGKHFLELPGNIKGDQGKYMGLMNKFLSGEPVPPLETQMVSPGGIRWEEVYPALLHKDGEPQAIQVIIRDITERKEADEKIRASLREKEVLLKEIHHRVKNNLQIIHSLLNMQSRRVKDERILDALRESQNRVRTMALIHERLYRSTDLSEIDFKEYISRLAGELYISFGANAEQIRLELDLHEVKLGVDNAIPCGFIINELVSNSLKHGFPNGKRGCLWITLDSEQDGTVRMGIGDTGVGLPQELDFKKTETLGLQLVCTLVDQLRGTIELDRGRGTEFKIVFNPARAEGG